MEGIKMNGRKIKVAAVQVAPVLPLNKEKTVEKVCEVTAQAADAGAKLIVFPECFIPMYPNWSIDLERPNEWALNLLEFTQQSITVPGPETEKIGRVAREKGVHIVIGVNEKVDHYDGALFNTLLFIGPDGNILGKHRKLFPSNREKVIHARGDASGLQVYDTSIGRIGGLICYEHLQPLLKYSIISQGEQIHCASWPGWPDFAGGRTNKHVIDAASRAYALEGQSFVIVSSLYVPRSEKEAAGFGNADWSFFGGSGIINPAGEYIAGPVYDEETIVYGEIDLDLITLRKAAVDTTGRDTAWETISMNLNPTVHQPIHQGPAKASMDVATLTKSFEEMKKKVDELSNAFLINS
jgi:nitrilase